MRSAQGVELFDWNCMTSATVAGGTLRQTLRKMMPTVGCEADAVAFTEEAADLWEARYAQRLSGVAAQL
jgi:hypothetical protein